MKSIMMVKKLESNNDLQSFYEAQCMSDSLSMEYCKHRLKTLTQKIKLGLAKIKFKANY